MMKLNQTADYYRSRIEAVEDYIYTEQAPKWETIVTILGLPVPAKKSLETPDFMKEVG